MKYENVVEDFDHVLRKLGIEPVGKLPLLNQTENRPASFWEEYTEKMQARAIKMYGPFMKEWGYEFPESWEGGSPTAMDRISYRFWGSIRRQFWRINGRLLNK